MAVCELAENLIKYSVRNGDPAAGSIGISVSGRQIRIRSTNTVASPADAQLLLDLIAKITPANVESLYQARFGELFKDPTLTPTQLGILRIGFEGRFALSCSYVAPQLQIVAERTCTDAA